MQRRTAWLLPALLWARGVAAAGRAEPGSAPAGGKPERYATAWRLPGPELANSADRVGVLALDWAANSLRIEAEVAVPSRAHGLLPLADGGFVAVAARPGRWLLRCDAAGRQTRLHSLDSETPRRSLNGHVEVSTDGHWLYTTETDPHTGAGWVGVRDANSLQRQAQFSTAGVDPHQLLLGPQSSLMVANGGIARDALGRKIDGAEIESDLVSIHAPSGRLQGRWRLGDAQLSLRHLAWATGPQPLLGVALQAEHAHSTQRAQAPTLAVWDGQSLSLPCGDPRMGGYAADIAAGPGGGFVLSAQKQGRVLWWQPAQPGVLSLVAQVREPSALAGLPNANGVTLSAANGVARWLRQGPPSMLAWPAALVPDNHWVRLNDT